MKTKLKIAILGCRGIPNHYGGYGQLAEYLSTRLVERGLDVWVYNVHNHPYQNKTWNGVNLIHCYDAEPKIGTAGQFIYDLNCILDARKRNFDVILQLGYTSSTIWYWLMPKKAKIVTNMDGLEWKRSKYSNPVQQFLKVAEWLGIISSDELISDSIGIENYITKKYNKPSTLIAYGANTFSTNQPKHLKDFKVSPYNYDMLIARMEPENHILEIIEGRVAAKVDRPLLVVGNTTTPFGKKLFEKHQNNPSIIFTQGIYDIDILNHLRHYCNLYFHGHSVGGTNPSLLEAMASKALICANDNIFNRSILDQNALYFKTSKDITKIIENTSQADYGNYVEANFKKIASDFNWDLIATKYYDLILKSLSK